jgi:hypothetical protein
LVVYASKPKPPYQQVPATGRAQHYGQQHHYKTYQPQAQQQNVVRSDQPIGGGKTDYNRPSEIQPVGASHTQSYSNQTTKQDYGANEIQPVGTTSQQKPPMDNPPPYKN